MQETKTVIVAGGGVGGIIAANELRRRLPKPHRVVLIEQNPVHAFAPSFLWLMTGDRTPEQISRPLASLLRPGVELVQAVLEGVNPTAQTVASSHGELRFDHLVLALGAELAPELIPGLIESGFASFYSLESAKQLRQTLHSFSAGRIALVVCAMPYKCPGAPHEGAMLIAEFFRRRGLLDAVELDLFSPESQPMPVGGPKLGRAVVQMLAMKGVSFYPQHKLIRVDGQARQLFFEGRKAWDYDLLIAVPPHRAPVLLKAAGLANEAGWVPVERRSLETKVPCIHALGDLTAIPIPGRWQPDTPLMLPKAGVFAHAQAEVVAERIAAAVCGRQATAEFCGHGYCMLEAGSGYAGFAHGNFLAEPLPQLEMRNLGRAWHLGKVLFEQWWLAPFGLRKTALHAALKIGIKALKLPLQL